MASKSRLSFTGIKIKKMLLFQLWRQSWQNGIANGAAFFLYSVNPIILANYVKASELPVLILPTRIAQVILESIRGIINPNIIYLIEKLSSNKIFDFFRIFWKSYIITLAYSLLAYGLFFVFGKKIIKIWSHGAVNITDFLIFLIIISYLLILLQNLIGTFIVVHGRQPFALSSWISAIVNIIAVLIFIPKWGIYGAVLSSIVGEFISSFLYTLYLFFKQLKYYINNFGVELLKNSFRESIAIRMLNKI